MSDLDFTGGTPDLDDFIKAYNEDDNIWWAIECGHHQNLFDEAVFRMEFLEKTVAELRRQAMEHGL